MLATGPHRELTRTHEAADRHAMVGGRPARVEVGLEVRLAQPECLVELLDHSLDPARHEIVASAVEQPDLVAREVGRIINDAPRPSLPDQPNGVLGLGWGGTQAEVAVPQVVAA